MANTEAELGYGSVVKFETVDGGGTYVTIEEQRDLPEFGDDSDLQEVTHQESPDSRKEFIAGLAEGSEYSFECNYVRGTVQDAIRAARGTTRNFRLVYSTTPALTLTFPAVILSAKISAPVNAAKALMIRLKISGDVTES